MTTTERLQELNDLRAKRLISRKEYYQLRYETVGSARTFNARTGKVIKVTAGVLFGLFAVVIIIGLMIPSTACDKDWRRCSDNSELANSVNQDFQDATVPCKMAAEKSARYGAPKIPWNGFHSFLTGNDYVKTGRIVRIDKNSEFQNGFGAWEHVDIVCTYDLVAKKVVSVSIERKD
jgi:hypothetical protein